VAVVTDSAASLPGGLLSAAGVLVVPLRVQAGDAAADDAEGGIPDVVDAQLRAGHRLLTSRPAPAAFASAYRGAAREGASSIVSVHLSGLLSGTIEAARLAAAQAPVPVLLVDSRSIGLGQGLAALAAAAAARQGQAADQVAAAAVRRAGQISCYFAVDSGEPLLAGGRLAGSGPGRPQPAGWLPRGGPWLAAIRPGPPASTLASRPLLAVRDGGLTVLERVRTRSAAAARLAELAAEFAGGTAAEFAVEHTAAAARAQALRERLCRAMPQARSLGVAEASAAVQAHTGPGMLGVVIARPRSPG
jgi:fatty acid-binding protein DegV